MRYNVYAVIEQRSHPSGKITADLYKICPSYEDALDVYKEKVGEPQTIREEAVDGGVVWWLDQDSTGAGFIIRYTLEGPLEEVD